MMKCAEMEETTEFREAGMQKILRTTNCRAVEKLWLQNFKERSPCTCENCRNWISSISFIVLVELQQTGPAQQPGADEDEDGEAMIGDRRGQYYRRSYAARKAEETFIYFMVAGLPLLRHRSIKRSLNPPARYIGSWSVRYHSGLSCLTGPAGGPVSGPTGRTGRSRPLCVVAVCDLGLPDSLSCTTIASLLLLPLLFFQLMKVTNVEAAINAGMVGIHFKNSDSLKLLNVGIEQAAVNASNKGCLFAGSGGLNWSSPNPAGLVWKTHLENVDARHDSVLEVWMLDRGVGTCVQTGCLEVAQTDGAVRMVAEWSCSVGRDLSIKWHGYYGDRIACCGFCLVGLSPSGCLVR
ncbi:hypothetical protein KSP40_PGU016978 [Platanthera guangdongensis]|uniref:Uncharacterized protein n=1 Tax=Platanthera guangdongensis TaxID=2320717 RepID=A0ABR2MZ59_9ASPA